MVPTLKIPRDSLRNNGFINGYIKDEQRDVQYENAVYLLFRPRDIDKFREFLDSEYERTVNLIDDYDYPKGFVVVVYHLNAKYEADFQLVKLGKYSRTSADFQAEFPKTIKIVKNNITKEEISLQYRVFNRTQDLIEFWEERFGVEFQEDQEVWYGFNEENEVLTKEKLDEIIENDL